MTVTALTVARPATENALESTTKEPTFAELVMMGNQLVGTGYLPEHIRNGAQAAAIIMTGRELGMPPMIALRSLHMVKGKVVEDAASQLARFKTAGGKAHFVELSETRAELELVHPNGDKHVEVFTLDDAKRARLSGDNWQKYPRAMLRSRCITAALKSIGWDGGVGAYDPDEALAFEEPKAAAAVVVDPDLGPKKDPLRVLKERVRDELVRLGVTDEKEQREKVRGLNAGALPEGIDDWNEVLACLREKETPEPDETSRD